jgi:hypothetical protein
MATLLARMEAAIARLGLAGPPLEKTSSAPWISDLEHRCSRRLPPAFRLLCSSYTFPLFDAGGVSVFANVGDRRVDDITQAPFADPKMSQWLISRGFLQFGRPDSGRYDPVCFDLGADDSEPRILQFDHEDILLERTRPRSTRIADSFLDLLER